MGAWRDAIFEMLMQPATAPGLLDLSQCCVTNDTSCFYGGMFTNERVCEAPGRAVESASPHTFVSVRPGSLALAVLAARPRGSANPALPVMRGSLPPDPAAWAQPVSWPSLLKSASLPPLG